MTIKFIAWSVLITGLCILWGSDSAWNVIAQVLLSISPILLWSREDKSELSAPVPSHLRLLLVVLVVAIFGYFVVSAAMGWTKLNNEWFQQSGLRPYVAFLCWVLFMLLGYMKLIRRAGHEPNV